MRIRTIQSECLSAMKEMKDKSVDLILCDLPYGTTNCKWDSPIDLEQLWKQYDRVAKTDSAILLFAQTPFDKVLGASNLKNLRYEIIWEKPKATGFLNAKRMPLKAHENILVFYRSLPTYNPQKSTGHRPVNKYTKHTKDGPIYGKTKTGISGGGSTERYPRSVVKFSSDTQKSKIHPTQKPVDLLRWLIRTYSNKGDLVLDNCMGSGSTGVACALEQRNFMGIEIDPDFFATATERIEKIQEEREQTILLSQAH